MSSSNLLEKYFNQDKIGHAYLLKTKDFSKVIEIVKHILIKSNANEPNIELLIDNMAFPDLKIIESDGQWIKKEQILNLKEAFKTKSSYNGKQIYIIKNAENLNNSSGNTLLKFLEEPEENIIAFLITENKNKVLPTIVSRCQFVALDSNNEMQEDKMESLIEIINIMENKKNNASIELVKIFDELKDKNRIKQIIMEIIDVYDNIMLDMLNIKTNKVEMKELFDKIVKNNKIEDIKKRIEGLISAASFLDYNVNMKLWVDKLLISMYGVD